MPRIFQGEIFVGVVQRWFIDPDGESFVGGHEGGHFEIAAQPQQNPHLSPRQHPKAPNKNLT